MKGQHLWLSPDFWFLDNVSRVAYQETLVWDMLDYTELYVKFEDAAGNVSWPYWVPVEFDPDTPTHASLIKSVAPAGAVTVGDLLTYTLVISAPVGTRWGIYDLLPDVTFKQFIEQPSSVIATAQTITGSVLISPTATLTVSFVVQVNLPASDSWHIDLVNVACLYPADGALDDCLWSAPVVTSLTPMQRVYLPLVIRARNPDPRYTQDIRSLEDFGCLFLRLRSARFSCYNQNTFKLRR